ncbi:MAG: hypothetical protein GX816_04275 [Erysipelotrichia bacterium]|jgi:hypothetical protein|nr:hypothetical protein [Erysipelotrichia bacterium]
MIKPEDIEIRSAKFKMLDNGACGVEVEWTTPDLTPNVKFNLYSLSYLAFQAYCENGMIFKWCKQVVYENEIQPKSNYVKVIEGTQTKVYLFHGTNSEMLDDFLVRGTFFTDDLEIALKYGKTIYAVEMNKQSHNWFKRTAEGHYQCLDRIPLSHLIKLVWSDEQ